MEKNRTLAALDLGTTRTKAVVAEFGPDGVDVVGVAQTPSMGVQQGRIVKLEDAAERAEAAIAEAEMSCGREIKEVYLALSGGFLYGLNRAGMLPISQEVRPQDLGSVRDVAIAMPLAPDQQLLEAVSQGFTVDDTEDIEDPTGMYATRLDARYHVVVVVASAVKNLIKCCEQFGVTVKGLSLPQLASAEAVLEDDEKELGVCVVDMGGGTSDLAIYRDGILTHTAVLPIGGGHLTGDLTHGLMTPRNEAERIKLKHGCAHACLVDAEEMFEVPGLGGRIPRHLSRMELVEILGPRVEEIMALIGQEIDKDGGPEDLAAGVVFTGGTSELPGLLEVAEDILQLPVRKGVPSGVGGLHRVVATGSYATSVGLVLRAARCRNSHLTAVSRDRSGFTSALLKSYNKAKEFFL